MRIYYVDNMFGYLLSGWFSINNIRVVPNLIRLYDIECTISARFSLGTALQTLDDYHLIDRVPIERCYIGYSL